MARNRMHTIFDGMDFPDYKYSEYPKELPVPGAPKPKDGQQGAHVVVNSEAEEAAVRASWAPPEPEPEVKPEAQVATSKKAASAS